MAFEECSAGYGTMLHFGHASRDSRRDLQKDTKMISDSGKNALVDMVELQMYLLIQPQRQPCPMLPRSTKPLLLEKMPHCNPIESSAAVELVHGGFIEHSSSRTCVVSKSGYEFYRRELKVVEPTL